MDDRKPGSRTIPFPRERTAAPGGSTSPRMALRRDTTESTDCSPAGAEDRTASTGEADRTWRGEYHTCRKTGEKPGEPTSVTSIVGGGGHTSTAPPMAFNGPEKRSPAEDGEYVRVLVMDDEQLIRRFIESILGTNGYDVAQAGDGAAAIDLYRGAADRGKPFSLVITDLSVPGGMGGLDMFNRLRGIDPDVRAIVMSGDHQAPAMNYFKKYGFCDALHKPCKTEELLETVARAVGKAPRTS